jgi:hypothetical protein
MNIDIDEMQERIRAYYRRHNEIPEQFDFPERDHSVGPEIIHLTQKLGVFADAFIEDHK